MTARPVARQAASTRDVAERLLVACHEAGTRFVFGVPGGGSNLDVVGAGEALGMRFILTHTEAAAAIMAGVVGELTGSPGICVATRGPGAASAVNGVAQALLDRQPMILITDCVAASEREGVPHQRLDQSALFSAITLGSYALSPTDDDIVDDIVHRTMGGPPGPVHIDLDPTAGSPVRLPTAERLGGADLFAVAEPVERARYPVIIAGLGARAGGPGAAAEIAGNLADLGASAHVPILTTYRARGIVSDGSPWFGGVTTGATIEAPILEQADLVIGIGLDPVEFVTSPWQYRAPVVLLGAWPIEDTSYFGNSLAGEVVGELPALVRQLHGLVRSAWQPGTGRRHYERAFDELSKTASPVEGWLTPLDIVDIASALAPVGTTATVDAGAHMLLVVPRWNVASPGQLLISSGLATMGFALPAAIAASLVEPTQPVVCFTGDGGLGMVLGELETLARLDLNVVVVVFNDAALSLIAIKQSGAQGGAEAVTYTRTDFAAVARGCGLRGEVVTDRTRLEESLRRAFAHRGATLIDAQVDPSSYREVMRAIRGPRQPAEHRTRG